MDRVDQQFNYRLNIYALGVGVVSAFGAIAFRAMIAFVQNILFKHQIDFTLIDHLEQSREIWFILLPVFGFILSHTLIEKFASEARGHGVPEVIEAVQHKSGVIRKPVALVKTLASSLTIGSGGSLGREGPIVQIGAAIGSFLGQSLGLKQQNLKILVACGASAGIAATFNTPIAGVIFAIELILLEWRAKSFIPLVVSTVFATLISRYYLGNQPAFLVQTFSLKTNTEIVFYLFLGIITAVGAYCFVNGIEWVESKIKHILRNAWLRALVGGLMVGTMAYFFPQLYGGGYEAANAILHQELAVYLLLPLCVLKIISVGLTLGSGGSGGVFAPSLFMGALIGGLYGVFVHALFPDITMPYGAYALVGMGSFFAAVSRGTFFSIVILFEMTRNYSIILPVMFACVVADQVSVVLIGKFSLYARHLQQKKLPFATDFRVDPFEMTSVDKIMVTQIDCIKSGTLVINAWQKARQSKHSVYPVVGKDKLLLGVISYFDLELLQKKHGQKKVDEVMKLKSCIAFIDETARTVIEKLDQSRDPRVFIVERNSHRLLGVVTPTDLIRYHDEA
ncbi:chloride channel protein [bacterium]|nr:chloride channel protein [bacterium]